MEKETKQKTNFLEYILTHHRGTFVTLVLIPISVCYTAYLRITRTITRWIHTAPKLHDARVQRVVKQVKDWADSGSTQKLTTSRSGWFTMSPLVAAYKKTNLAIRMPMYDIVSIDTKKQTVLVEPLVDMGKLTSALNKKGWTLPVVPELDVLTVGGLINGFGIESSSHKYGLFQYTIVSLDIVTSEGKLVHCSAEENATLFYNIPWSHGTLGFLVAAELRIIPCKPYVKLHYQPLKGLDNLVNAFESASRNTDHQFVELLQFSKDEGVLMTGNFADKPDSKAVKNPIGRWYKPWFYTHVIDKMSDNSIDTEYIPLRHYYHRHTRGLFWEMSEVIPFGNHPVYRFLLGWAIPPQISLMKYFETETTERLREKYHVVQDMLVPVSHLKKSLEYFDDEYDIYPIWICPMSVYAYPNDNGFIHPYTKEDGTEDTLFVDIGVYGTPKKPGFDGNSALRELEKFVIAHNGYQAMYAVTLMNREQFRTMFRHDAYDKLRKKIPNCERAFGEVYDKLGGKARLSPAAYRKKKNV